MTAVIDGAAIETRDALHDTFHDQLALPDYYGRTLDALYDCLTDLHEEAELRVLRGKALEEHLGLYAGVMRRMLNDACEENPRLRLIWEE